MILEDITFETEINEVKLPDNQIPLKDMVIIQAQSITALKLFLSVYESKEWLHKATIRVLSDLYIKEANVQIDKAKNIMKEKPNFKTKIKWLLKLK